jgi:DNA polymerase III delta prime subunit
MRFEPRNQNQFIGNDNPNSPLFYLDEWQSDSPQRLLFSGAPGLGKTTAAYLIAKHLNLDVVEFNASDERGIDAVRNKIREVAYSSSLWSARLILLDEFEGMTKPAQEALKRMMEKSNCWWILTCNDDSSIIPAIKSRCVQFQFAPYTEEEVRAYAQLLVKEVGLISQDSPAVLHSHFGGDLRAIQNHIASGATLGEIQTNFDSLALDIAGGEWTEAHKTMLSLCAEGVSIHQLMRRLHEHVKSVGLSSERLYTFLCVWGDFVLRMHQWPLGVESFIDYFVATLHNQETKTGGQ